MKLIRYPLTALAAMLIFVLLFFIAAGIADYKPDEITPITEDVSAMPITDSSFTALIWNTGYAGLDASMDFFYDGGEKVRPLPQQVAENTKQILNQLMKYSGSDFLLLQEVDRNSKRSYGINLSDSIRQALPDRHSAFALNYRSSFVPLPLRSPMGRVESGLLTLSAHNPKSTNRHQFPGNYSWPTRLFMLDRCFMVSRFPFLGKELLVINTHNSAYDDGTLREKQMKHLQAFLLNEYEQGNYVVVGGDWNQTPPGFKPRFDGELFDRDDLTYLSADYPESGWTWAYDTKVPTNRRLKIPYVKGKCATTVIDLYLLSPNLSVDTIQTIDLGFRHSDHQPVRIVFSPDKK